MVLHIFACNFLNIQLVFNLKKVLKSWDLELAFQPYHQILCTLKHVGGVEGQNNLRHLCIDTI